MTRPAFAPLPAPTRMMKLGSWRQLLTKRQIKSCHPEYRFPCGHERTRENSIWRTQRWAECKRCRQIGNILAAFERLDD